MIINELPKFSNTYFSTIFLIFNRLLNFIMNY